MTAQIIPFPSRRADAERLALVGKQLKDALPIAPRDAELDLLLQIGSKLLDNINDYEAVDCSGLMDQWLDRLDKWDAQNCSLLGAQ